MMQIDKENGGICFNDANHVYFEKSNPECKYVSVTTLIHGFCQPFDKGKWSAYKAMEKLLPSDVWKVERLSLQNMNRIDESVLESYGISVDEFNAAQQGILDMWDEENRKACERGTAIHLDLENSFYTGKGNLKKFGIGGKFICKKDYTDLDLDYGIYPEYLVSKKSKDGILRIAGQVDLIVKSKNDITIIDHKGLPLYTPVFTKQGFKSMADIVIGDKLFDKDGKLCTVVSKSSVHFNPCYEITFDNNETIVADFEHKWVVSVDGKECVLTTEEISKEKGVVRIDNVKPIEEGYSDRMEMLKVENDKNRLIKLAGLLGIKPIISDTVTISKEPYRTVVSCVPCKSMLTQCIEVDSPTHTYCFGYSMIPTHNTNKEIKKKGSFNPVLRKEAKMLYPLNNLSDCNFSAYSLQLSTYAWMLQQINPDFKIKDLILNHYDHKGNNTLYHCDYLKGDVERMLAYYKKQLVKQHQIDRRKPIEY